MRSSKWFCTLLMVALVCTLLPGMTFAAATGAPGNPSIKQSNWNNSPNYAIGFDMWWGNNGTSWKLYENGTVIYTGTLTDNSPNGQSATYAFTNKPSGTYVYKIDLVNSYGTTTSGNLTYTVAGGTSDNQPPSVPTGLAVSNVTENSLILSWAASTDNVSVTGYEVYQGATLLDTTAATTYNVTGLTPNTSYSFTVKAKDAAGNVSAASAAVTATTKAPDTTPPSIPTGLATSNVTENSLTLTWTASTDDVGVTGYEVYQGTTLLDTTAATTYNVTGLTPNTSYSFTIKAKDAAGNISDASSSLSVTTTIGPVDQTACRPEGLYDSGVAGIPYCDVYDINGREKLPNGLERRIIGYFTSWRTGTNGQARYIASDIPWTKLSHINYAFAHINSSNQISVGSQSPTNPATGMTWPGVPGAEMDPAYSYQGHFNLLNKFKKQNPGVKALVSVGGWAETGGFFDDNGQRVSSGGFYTMTTNADGSVNQAGIDTFADSAIVFLRQYGFDGVDIDYEYPTTMNNAGNPLDWSFSTPRLKGLQVSYDALLKTLRTKLDQASAQDGKYYMLTIASPSSGYLLRGMETFQQLKYLDYVNVMSYDLHGAWNKFVGPNAALFDDGKDGELAGAGVYNMAEYGGIGYLNTDWAYHYMRGMMQAGRINVGVPYYTRGFKNVTGGTNGLWGTAPATTCPAGSGLTACGDGAVGIDNLWHDLDSNGNESPAGSNPMWHAKNMENGILGSYLGSYGLGSATLTGTYARNYDATLVAPWLWNSTTRVFLSTEDEQSLNAKADWAISNGVGGLMIWELAGDYDWNAAEGEYGIGYTLTNTIYNKFSNTTPYGNTNSATPLPANKLKAKVEFTGFKLGDQNYPINIKMKVTNNSDMTITGGSVFEFDVPTSVNPMFKSWNGDQVSVISTGHTGNNIGGLDGDFHRVAVTLQSYKSIAPGASELFDLVYYLPISGPANATITIDGVKYAVVP